MVETGIFGLTGIFGPDLLLTDIIQYFRSLLLKTCVSVGTLYVKTCAVYINGLTLNSKPC